MKFVKRLIPLGIAFSMLFQTGVGAVNNYAKESGKGYDVKITNMYLSKPDFEIGDQVTLYIELLKTGDDSCPQQWLDVRNMVGCSHVGGGTSMGLMSQQAISENGGIKVATVPSIKITSNKVSMDVNFYADDIDPKNNKGVRFEAESTKNAVDIILNEVTIKPESFKVGDNVKVYAKMRNQGGVDADYSMMNFKIADGKKSINTQKPVSFLAGEEKTIEVGEITAQSNELNLTVTANANKALKEIDYTNNKKSVQKKSFAIDEDYVWDKLGIASGGFVIGSWVDPKLKRTYITTDVGGFYKYNYTLNMFEHYGLNINEPSGNACMTLQGVYGNEDILFAYFGGAMGGSRGYADYGDIHRSMDGGNTWQKMYAPIDINHSRKYADQMGVDQNNPNCLYALDFYGRVYKTENALSAAPKWQKLTLPGYSGVYDSNDSKQPDMSNITMSLAVDYSQTVDGKSKNIYISATGDGIFQSSDGGKTFKLMKDSPKMGVGMRVDTKGNLYVACEKENGGLWRWDGNEWKCIFNTTSPLRDVDVSPFDDNTIVVSAQTAIWVSQDGGVNFRKISSGSKVTNSNKFNETSPPWQYIGALCFDPVNPKGLWFGDFYGIFKTEDYTVSNVEFTGLAKNFEELVLEGVTAYKTADRLSTVTMDGPICVKEGDSYFDNWKSSSPHNAKGITTSHGQDYCFNHPEWIVFFGGNGWDMNPTNGAYTSDAGGTWIPFNDLIPNYPGQDRDAGLCNVAMSSDFNENGVPTMVVTSALGYVYRTDDLGKNWTIISNEGGGYIWGHSIQIVADPYKNGVFYLYSLKDGTFLTSTDDGKSFSVTSKLPYSSNPSLRMMYEKENHLGIALGNAGLWLSADAGVSFKKIEDFNNAKALGVGKPQNGSEYDTLFVLGSIGEGELGVYQSTDFGKNWTKLKLLNYSLYKQLGSIDGDKFREGVFYAASGGFGCVVGMPKDKIFKPFDLQFNQADGITVKNSEFTLSGACNQIVDVEISVNGEKTTTSVDKYYNFSKTVSLKEGVNKVTAKVGNGDNAVEQTINVTCDPNYVEIKFNNYASTTKEDSITLLGSVNCDAQLKLSGTPISVNDKRFEVTVYLDAGENKLVFEATDEKGNSKTETITVVRDITPPEISFALAQGASVDDCYITVDAVLSEDATVEFDGEKYECTAGAAQFKKLLSSGENKLVFNLTDRVGNTAQKILTLNYNDSEFLDDPMAVNVLSGAPTFDGVCSDGEWRLDRIARFVPTGETHNVARFGLRSDGTDLYVGVKVEDDDVVVTDAPDAASYVNDTVEIFIDADGDRSSSRGSRDLQLRADLFGSVYNCAGSYMENASSKTTLTDDGYFMEIKIPLADVCLTYGAGTVFGFDMAVNNAKTLGTRTYIISWSGDGQAWQTTANYGTAIFQ